MYWIGKLYEKSFMDSFSKTSVPPECICNNASINKPASHGSAASTEFQTVRDTFSAMKLKQTNLRESETSKCVVDNEDLEKRGRNSSELTPGDVVREFSQYSQRVRRNSFPSLELVAVDIQYSVPTKTISAPRRRSRGHIQDAVGSGLHCINEIPERSGWRASNSTRVSGSSNLLQQRRFSTGAQRNMTHQNAPFNLFAKHRRASLTSTREKQSSWRVKLHHWSIDLDEDDDNSRLQGGQTRRTSLPNISNFTHRTANGPYNVLPKIDQRNSLVGALQEKNVTHHKRKR